MDKTEVTNISVEAEEEKTEPPFDYSDKTETQPTSPTTTYYEKTEPITTETTTVTSTTTTLAPMVDEITVTSSELDDAYGDIVTAPTTTDPKG